MSKSFFKDFSWYFIGSFLPILLGILKTPIFTRHFNNTSFGILGLVVVTFSFFGMFFFSWVSSCIWRYYPKYNKLNKLNFFYSNLFFLLIISVIILLIITGIWYYFEHDELIKELILYSFLGIIFSQLYSYYLIVVRVEGKAKFYTYFQSIRAFFSFLAVLFLVFILELNISALVLGVLIIDVFCVLYLVIKNPSKISIDLSLIRKKYLKELLVYGSAGLLLNTCFLIISASDRYIIAWLGDVSEVGIYDQTYKIGQLSIMALVTIFLNTTTPTLIHELESDYKNSKYMIREYLKAFVVFGFPVVFYGSFFSKDIAYLFLGNDFRAGYMILPFVFFAAFFHGILNFYELRLKFTNKLKQLSLIIVFGTLINILLTTIFVSTYNYLWAAYTTTFTYVVLLASFHINDKDVIVISLKKFNYLPKLLLIGSIQLCLYFVLDSILVVTFTYKVSIIVIFICSYFYFLNKSIKNTFKFLK